MSKRTLARDLYEKIGENVTIKGYVEKIRNMGGLRFIDFRDRSGTTQVVLEKVDGEENPLKRYDIVSINGEVKDAINSKAHDTEIQANGLEVISSPNEAYPISVTPKSNEKIETILGNRPVALRNPRIRNIFKMQQTLAKSFRDYLSSEGFTEIFSPKIVPAVAESGSNQFKLDYFGNPAFLTQSPQLYKQMLVGSGLERVFEVGHVYRAEEHDTSRHLNEYVSLDIEMGFIDSFNDLLDLEEGLMRYIFSNAAEEHPEIFDEFGVKPPKFDRIPRVPLSEMVEILKRDYKHKVDSKDIDPKGEKLATQYAQENFGSDFIFLTHYPVVARPFYTMPSENDPNSTESFDLLLNGVEITTGGQRIHNYEQLLGNVHKWGIDPESMGGYLSAFKYGMPPHGGMGIGLERLTARTLGLKNIKEASLFPRDRSRFSP